MEIKEAIKILDDVIPPPDHKTVDLDHLPICQAWVCVKDALRKLALMMVKNYELDLQELIEMFLLWRPNDED